jgi:hypothetical protein
MLCVKEATRQGYYALRMLRVKDATRQGYYDYRPRSEGSQRASRGGESLVVRVNGIITFLTRTTLVKRPFKFILVFTDDTHAYRQLLNTGYHEKSVNLLFHWPVICRPAHHVLAMSCRTGTLNGLKVGRSGRLLV